MKANIATSTVQTEMVYTVKEVAEILRCGVNFVYKLIDTGKLRCMKLGNMKVRKSTLEEFLAKWEGYDLTDPNNPVKIEVGDSNNAKE